MAIDKETATEFLDVCASDDVVLTDCPAQGCHRRFVTDGDPRFEKFLLPDYNEAEFGATFACGNCGCRAKRFLATDGRRFAEVLFGTPPRAED